MRTTLASRRVGLRISSASRLLCHPQVTTTSPQGQAPIGREISLVTASGASALRPRDVVSGFLTTDYSLSGKGDRLEMSVPSRVAVIVVHGVGDQAPRTTASFVEIMVAGQLPGARYVAIRTDNSTIGAMPFVAGHCDGDAGLNDVSNTFRNALRQSLYSDLHTQRDAFALLDLRPERLDCGALRYSFALGWYRRRQRAGLPHRPRRAPIEAGAGTARPAGRSAGRRQLLARLPAYRNSARTHLRALRRVAGARAKQRYDRVVIAPRGRGTVISFEMRRYLSSTSGQGGRLTRRSASGRCADRRAHQPLPPKEDT